MHPEVISFLSSFLLFFCSVYFETVSPVVSPGFPLTLNLAKDSLDHWPSCLHPLSGIHTMSSVHGAHCLGTVPTEPHPRPSESFSVKLLCPPTPTTDTRDLQMQSLVPSLVGFSPDSWCYDIGRKAYGDGCTPSRREVRARA